MTKVKNILPSILYLLIFISLLGLIVVLLLNTEVVKKSNFYKKVLGERVERVYQLKEGTNFIGLDFNSKNFALKILKENPDITLIGDYDDNEWKNIVQNTSKRPTKGKNFKLKQFKGYIVISSSDTQISIEGREYDRKLEDKFDEGLNLISTLNYNTSSELINGFKDDGINILGVSTWSNSISNFESFVIDNGIDYGKDIKIDSKQGVFIKVK